MLLYEELPSPFYGRSQTIAVSSALCSPIALSGVPNAVQQRLCTPGLPFLYQMPSEGPFVHQPAFMCTKPH